MIEMGKFEYNKYYLHLIEYVNLLWYRDLLYFQNYTRSSIITYDVQ